MPYATISTWKLNDKRSMDQTIEVIRNKYMPALKALGATSVMAIRTGEDSSAFVSVFPDEATRNAAMERITALRGEARREFDSEMTGEMKGDVVASA